MKVELGLLVVLNVLNHPWIAQGDLPSTSRGLGEILFAKKAYGEAAGARTCKFIRSV